MRHAMLARGNSMRSVPKAKAASETALGSLRIGEANDSFEQEADRIADEVMSGRSTKRDWSFSRMSVGAPLRRKCACGGSAGSEGECEECKAEKAMQRKPAGAVETGVAPPIVHEVLRSPGQPLDAATRAFFEPRFGHDFSRVRVHTDSHAGNSAKAVSAYAYTAGNDIVFDDGRYSPTCAEGRKLLAHELVHTVQQRPVLSRQAKKDGDPANRPLPPHDPSAHFAPVGACYGSAICRDLITPSKLLAEAAADPTNKAKREHRKQVCQSKPPDPACTADGHGSEARETAKLLHDYDSSRPAAGVKFLINKDLESDFKALTMRCSDFMPPVSGATTCITVPSETENEAAQFNNTMDPTIGGEERGKWRERMVEVLVHESEHARFRAAFQAGSFPQATQQACATNDTLSAMNELAAMLTEFPIRMERIRTSVGLSPEDKQKELEEWREHRILGEKQSITVSLRTVRCACNCDDANKMIRETVEFTTASWTQQQKNDLHREMRDPRWSDLDLRWPFVAPPVPSVTGQTLQRKSTGAGESGVAPPIVHEALNSPGRPLDEATRSFFEPRYGHDFSNVRVHHDQRAAESAEAVDALAYTVGFDIVFAHGQHAPNSTAGRALLAHELTHVVQGQNRSVTNGPAPLPVSNPENAGEREADAAVDKIEMGERSQVRMAAPPSIQRQPDPAALPHLDLAESASPFAAAAFGSVTLDSFETGKADIPGPDQIELARTVETIWTLLKQYPASTIHVIGYTDAVGQESDNQALGQARADSVQAALLAMGLPAVSIHAESRGAAELRVKTKKGEPRNRRVEVRFETSRRFSRVMSSGLTSTPTPSPGPSKTGVVSPADFCAQNPTLCLGKQGGDPGVPPAATQSVPSGTPFELMDIPALNEPFISHGRSPQEGGDLRETWARLYWKYRLDWHLSKELAAKAANSELSSTAGSSESRDNPNAVDRTNREMQQAYPNATSVGPFNFPFKWRF